ncbi:protein PRRC1 isoform X2 [Cephus cinctus]|nr:protein PRRC1 isoform X2 [Cephus cinctus]XP_024944089.1 protein PRRC1 isoform X2 [Cephus cinctus]XP_024944090.1 protein PRRC1 isoform X2 [Cephus cinctus]
MTEESSSDSTFEFVEKKADEFSFAKETTKTESLTSVSSSASINLPTTISTSIGSLLSNVAPPSSLPSFIINSTPISSESSTQNQVTRIINNNEQDDSTKRPNQLNTTGAEVHENQQGTYYSAAFSPAIPPIESSEVPLILENSLQDLSSVSGGLLSWVKETVTNNSVLNKVAEKAKSSVNSMITTLDPQMREFIYSGGDVDIIVASDKDVKVSPIREAFQDVFGKATVTGLSVNAESVAAQPVGFAAGVKGAEERINSLRNNSVLPKDIAIIALENFIVEIGEDKWYDLGVLVLNDPKHNVNLQSFTQMTPVPSQIVGLAQQSTPEDYSLKKSGLAVTIGSLMANNLQVSHNQWHHALTGISRRDMVLLAAQSLAGIYKNTINSD